MSDDTHALVNLEAIRGNARRLAGFAGKPILAPIKADAYGHGAVRVALALEPLVWGFAVATASEALELRAADIVKDVLLLTPPRASSLAALQKLGLSDAGGAGELVCSMLSAERGNTRVAAQVAQAWSRTAAGGVLLLAGDKDKGFERYFKAAVQVFGDGEVVRRGNGYRVARLMKTKLEPPVTPAAQRFTFSARGRTIECSAQPGVFAAGKLDAASAVMLSSLPNSAGKRVLDIGTSRELCGGTHVQRSGDIGLFKIVSEGGVAAGIRRVEAVTGGNALHYLQQLEATVSGLAGTLKVTPAEVAGRVGGVLEQVRSLEKELVALKSKLASSQGDELLAQAVDVAGIKVLAATLQGADAKALRETMDKLKDKLKHAVIVLAAVEGGRVQLAAGVTADVLAGGKLKAGDLVNFVAQQVGGKGGGKPDMAMAGGTDSAALPAALASVVGWVGERA